MGKYFGIGGSYERPICHGCDQEVSHISFLMKSQSGLSRCISDLVGIRSCFMLPPHTLFSPKDFGKIGQDKVQMTLIAPVWAYPFSFSDLIHLI